MQASPTPLGLRGIEEADQDREAPSCSGRQGSEAFLAPLTSHIGFPEVTRLG